MSEGLIRAEEAVVLGTAPKYQVELPQWSGPYDLLLKVIDEQQLDLFDLDISVLLEHYLKHLESLSEVDIDEAGDFLVVAATLAQIKSKMLLPEEPKDEEEEERDPREELVYYLQEYQKIKARAAELRERPLLGRDVFTKGATEHFQGIEGEGRGTLFQLVKGFQRAMHRAQPVENFNVEREDVSVSDRFREILELLKTRSEVSFDDLLPENQGRRYLIASFLAILEMVRLKKVKFYQSEHSDQIFLERDMGSGDNEVYESEFDYREGEESSS